MGKPHKKQHHEEHIDETWLIPYADLLTLLLALFIILFASSKMDAKKYDTLMASLHSAFNGGAAQFQLSNLIPVNSSPNMENKKEDRQTDAPTAGKPDAAKLQEQLQKEEKDLEELKHNLDKYIADNNLIAQLDTKLTNERLVITIRDRALFDSGSAAFRPDSQKLAAAIGAMLGKYPGYRIEVAGHTDNVPISRGEFETNWDLSAKRALNFMKILLATSGIDPALFSSIGYGEYHPVASNDTAEGRAQNRRVEVSVIRHVKITDVAGQSGASSGP
ncbi:flagellar motor protein MotB [Gordoniibacillus kamchatkensis]|uniref:Flagellar motor protein MotB n=1 Tax=Gordoniibacillus kamchatkensis TaxID=1590651 RepID=A0ABR5ABV9_9BACL|nr:flagellar motor protein MotB [Paenibacillus sp. VKM B-2647]KIL38529.1 flagellar motor protein MotB [Paenibacillus sp. VKM B-2647]